jgi:hypothetical protein
MSRTVSFRGQPYQVDENTNLQDLRKAENIPNDQNLVVVGENGYEIFNEKEPLPPNADIREMPRYIRAIDPRKGRIKKEFVQVKSEFDIRYDYNNLNYVEISNFLLNRHFNYRSTKLLVRIPKNYPYTPPDHFYLRPDVKYKGKKIAHLFVKDSYNELRRLGWAKYCLHTTSWNPKANIFEGDSLITYLEMIKTALDNIEGKRKWFQ